MTQAEDATRTTPAGWRIRWNAALAQQAYADGWWRTETCADALHRAASETPDRVLVIDGVKSLSAADVHDQASRLARAMRGPFRTRQCRLVYVAQLA